MKKFILLSLCILNTASLGENALTAAKSQRLEFKAQSNAFDLYADSFVAFDKGASIMQSYEKLTQMHGILDENNSNAPNDSAGCACVGLTPSLKLYEDLNHQGNKYIWQDKKLIIERRCWGAGEYYFELEAVNGGVKISTKFSRD